MNIEITKFKAAESQLITAIDLYFKNGDPVSIHTLARSAHEVLDRLCEHEGLDRSVIEQGVAEFVKPEFKKQVFQKVSESRNFFKHADKDPEGVLSWNPDISIYFIWDATSLYRRLNKSKMPCEILVFSGIFRIEHSDIWTDESPIDHLLESGKEELRKVDKKTVYETLLNQCRRGDFDTLPK